MYAIQRVGQVAKLSVLLFTLLIAAFVVGVASGLGLLAAAFGFGTSEWRQRWGIWLPSIFGVSLSVGMISFLVLLLAGSTS